MLLDALALADHHVDIVSAFGADDLEDDRLHHAGSKMLKTVLQWAQRLGNEQPIEPQSRPDASNVLIDDLADRIRERGLNVAVDYGLDNGMRLPMVVGAKDKPYTLAVFTDDAQFMGIQSTRERHRILQQEMGALGWSVMTIWSVAAFVNPEKEVDRVVARLGELYQEGK